MCILKSPVIKILLACVVLHDIMQLVMYTHTETNKMQHTAQTTDMA